MGTLLELFTILDGYDGDRLPNEVRISPDPALEGARRALQGQGNIQLALDALDEQIRVVRPAMRAQLFDVIETVHSERGWSEQKIFRLASDLHRHSAVLYLALGSVEQARRHLLRAIMCQPDDPNLSFHLVDAYVQEGRFRDGFALLDRTYEMFAPGRPEQLLALYRLTLDARKAGRIDDARPLYQAIARKSHAGLFAGLCERQLADLESRDAVPPGVETLNLWYTKAMERHRAGAIDDAVSLSCDVLAWEPAHETSWFFVGHCYATATWRAEQGKALFSIPKSIDDERRKQLEQAVQALRIAATFEERPDIRLESFRLLAACYLELARPADAVAAATAVTKMDDKRAGSWGNLSAALLANKAFAEAAEAALKAVELDEREPVANNTLAMLRRIVEEVDDGRA